MELVYYGHLGNNHKWPDYQGILIFQISLYDKAPYRTITKYVDYTGVNAQISLYNYGSSILPEECINNHALVNMVEDKAYFIKQLY